MKRSFVLATVLTSSLLLTGCAFNTVSNTTIKKNSTNSITPPPPPQAVAEKEEPTRKIKKIVKDSGVPQYGPNIYKSAAGPSCNGAQCIKPIYDITQTKCLDFPITYRAKREIIQKDTVLFEE